MTSTNFSHEEPPSGGFSSFRLRPYQVEAVEASLRSLKDNKSSLLVMATGLGKTVVFAEIIRRAQASGRVWRCMVLAHREELIFQASRTISKLVKCDVDIEMGELRAQETIWNQSPVVVSSIQTQCAGRGKWKRMKKFDPKKFGLIIIDEAHHATSESYRKVIDWYRQNPDVRILGVTATPDRADQMALGEVFDTVAYEYGIREGIEHGWLCPIRQRLVNVGSLDFSACRTTAGDLNGADLDVCLQYEETLHGMVYPTIKIVGERRCLIFATSVAHSGRIAEILNRHKAGCAVSVDAKTPRDDRRHIFKSYSEGKYQFLVNVGVATEGWDDPALDSKGVQVVAIMKPTKSRSLYSQMIGRGTRPIPGTVEGLLDENDRRERIAESDKPYLEVLDYCGNAGRHKLIHCSDVLGGTALSDEACEKAEDLIMEMSEVEAVDVLAACTQAERVLEDEKQASQRKGIMVRAQFSTQLIDPFSLVELAPDREQNWQKGRPATEKQLAYMRRLGIEPPNLCTSNEAKELIDIGVSTPSERQAYVLRKAGLNPDKFDRKSASEMIDKIKKESGL